MLVTLKGEAFVVTSLVEGAECEREGEAVDACAPWLPMTLPKNTIPPTRKQTMMTNVCLVLLLLRIETPLFRVTRRRDLTMFGLLV